MIDKLKPKYLETSKDSRSKSSEELIDALNITVTADEGGGDGVVKNIKGTKAVIMSLPGGQPPSGKNTCIGSVRDEALGVVYFFMYNSNLNHGVYAYSAKTDTYRLIFLDSPEEKSLNFSENGFVKADIIRAKRRAVDSEFITDVVIEDVVTPDIETDDEVDDGISEPLLFTGNLCDYPGLIGADGFITEETINAYYSHVLDLISLSGLSDEAATYLFPNMDGANPHIIDEEDLALVLALEIPLNCDFNPGDNPSET